MKAKIEWYQEVLELEPSSKVFFPLARLLADNGQPANAIATLRQGLDRHPEFIEARLFLIELLHAYGDVPQRDAEVARLSGLFSSYPGFWDAWSASVTGSGANRDTAVALGFVAAAFRNGGASWTHVLQLGLQALGGPAAASVTQSPAFAPQPDVAPTVSPTLATPTPERAEEVRAYTARITEPSPRPTPAMTAQATGFAAPVAGTSTAPIAPVAAAMGTHADDGDEDAEEQFSLRTRSMAEVLAEQGDLKGALEIYSELHDAAATPREREGLARRMDELAAGLRSVPAEPARSATDDEAPLQGKHKLLQMLGTLADRLEARAQD